MSSFDKMTQPPKLQNSKNMGTEHPINQIKDSIINF